MTLLSRRQLIGGLLAARLGAEAPRKSPARRLKLESELERAIDHNDALASASLGAAIVRLSDNKTIFERNSERLFTPASNSKLFTTALALTRLGPDYRFSTSVAAEGPLDASGRLEGNLILFGGGDPSLSARVYPYTKEPSQGDPLQAMDDLADRIATRGVRSISGQVIGDDSRYPWVPYPGGWSSGDLLFDYGAPVSAVVFNDNEIRLTIAPGDTESDFARISLSPAVEYLEIDNRIHTVAGSEAHLHAEREPGSNQLRLWGSIGLNHAPAVERFAVPEPALFGAVALRDALIRRGISIQGDAVARHRLLEDVLDVTRGDANPTAAGMELVHRTSPPLLELARVVDKASQNLHAELLLREVGAVRRNMGTITAGMLEMTELLNEAQISHEQVQLRDGSGLSRDSLVTPAAIAKLLAFLHRSTLGPQFASLLPIAGEDGSLRDRFKHHPEASRIQAKTGTLSGVRALSGYAESREHGPVAFSIVVNHATLRPEQFSKLMDGIGLTLLY